MIKGKIKIIVLVLTAAVGLMPAHSVFSYTVIRDPDLFYAFFVKPKMIIEFNILKDGTLFSDTTDGFESHSSFAINPDCLPLQTAENRFVGNEKKLAIRPYAFSNAWHFMGLDPENPQPFCDSVVWIDEGIATDSQKMAVVAASGRSQPFVLHTNKGFIGILPDNPHETMFVFDDFSRIFSFETDFSRDVSVSDSDDAFLATLSGSH